LKSLQEHASIIIYLYAELQEYFPLTDAKVANFLKYLRRMSVFPAVSTKI